MEHLWCLFVVTICIFSVIILLPFETTNKVWLHTGNLAKTNDIFWWPLKKKYFGTTSRKLNGKACAGWWLAGCTPESRHQFRVDYTLQAADGHSPAELFLWNTFNCNSWLLHFSTDMSGSGTFTSVVSKINSLNNPSISIIVPCDRLTFHFTAAKLFLCINTSHFCWTPCSVLCRSDLQVCRTCVQVFLSWWRPMAHGGPYFQSYWGSSRGNFCRCADGFQNLPWFQR